MAIEVRTLGVVAAGTANQMTIKEGASGRLIVLDEDDEPVSVLSVEQAKALHAILRDYLAAKT
jgi:ABC-type cobalamin transport system ATPase subunit